MTPRMRHVFLSIVTIGLILFPVTNCPAQVALNAPPEDPVYQAIDILVAHGLAGDVIVGQRPYSRLEIARILREARRRFDEAKESEETDWEEFNRQLMEKHYVDDLLSYYEKEYARELKGMEKA